MVKMVEKRSHPRFATDLEAEYATSDLVASVQATTHTFNISKGGVAISVNRSVSPGKAIRLRIKLLYGSEVINAWGRVAWVKPTERNAGQEADAGIKFLKMDEESERVLEEYIYVLSHSS
jgi:Tfp pilus assembly protein PilZ